MIHYIRFSNFYSFLEEQEISFVADKYAPDTTDYVRSAFGPILSRVLVCYGANASGKTNLVKAAAFLQYMMCASYGLAPDDPLPFVPFRGAPVGFHASRFEVEFEFGGRLFRYTLEFDQKRILSEQLDVREPATRFRYVVRRCHRSDESGYDVQINRSLDLFSTNIGDSALHRRGNATFIAIAAQAEDRFALDIQNYWGKIHTNVAWFGRFVDTPKRQLEQSSAFYYANRSVLDRAEHLLKKWDLGLERVDVRRNEFEVDSDTPESGDRFTVSVVHKSNGNSFKLPICMESSGTQALYVLLSRLVPVLDSGGVAAIDEFDADLHPFMVEALVDLFRSKHNGKPSQLLCTSHSTPMLNTLDRYQILLVEKDDHLRSNIWRLDEIHGVRGRDNYFAKYMAGAYGAIPDIG